MSVNATEVFAYVDLLRSFDQRVHQDSIDALEAAQEKLVKYAQRIAHRRSGYMADTIHAIGPFVQGIRGGMRSTLQSEAVYTLYEVSRGDSHDWMTRTIDDNGPLLDRLADDAAQAVEAAIVGKRKAEL